MRVSELEKAVTELTPQELASFAAWFSSYYPQAQGDGAEADEATFVSAYEASKHLAGCLKGGPSDLATNKKYLEGLGESSMR